MRGSDAHLSFHNSSLHARAHVFPHKFILLADLIVALFACDLTVTTAGALRGPRQTLRFSIFKYICIHDRMLLVVVGHRTMRLRIADNSDSDHKMADNISYCAAADMLA